MRLRAFSFCRMRAALCLIVFPEGSAGGQLPCCHVGDQTENLLLARRQQGQRVVVRIERAAAVAGVSPSSSSDAQAARLGDIALAGHHIVDR